MNSKTLIVSVLLFLFAGLAAFAQADRHDVRAGNRKFKKGDFKEAEIDYRKGLLKDSLSVPARYNLASSLYRQEDFEGASKMLSAPEGVSVPADFHFNAGDASLQKKDYASAVESFKLSLLQNPNDLEAKENYIYAKKMLENQQGGGGGNNNDESNEQNDNKQDDQNNKDQNQQDRQNNNDNNQNNDQNQNENQDQNQDNRGSGEGEISPYQAQQMLRAVQAKEKETMDKVNKEKAALLKSRQKEKNW